MQAPIMVCTSASVMIDQRLKGEYNGSTQRQYLIFDEADQLPGAAALHKDLSITAFELRDAGVRLEGTRETLESLADHRLATPELRAKARIMLEALDEPAWYHKVGQDDEEGLQLFHQMPGRLLRKIANREASAFISATLSVGGSFRDFKTSLGIDQVSRFSGSIEPVRHGTLSIERAFDKTPEELIDQVAKPCLVATTSHQAAKDIGEKIPGAIVRSPEETTAEAAERVSSEGVLVAAGAWAGLDTPRPWASIIIPKVPFERPTIIDDNIESSYINSRNTAHRRMRQVIGRGLRSPDAVCDIYLLDERVERIGFFLPKRFTEAWLEGERSTVILSQTERSRAYRQKVLEHYGAKCLACQFEPRVVTQIQVHHLDPISEGVRETMMEDLVPLCANCHILAHSRKPNPLTIAELKQIVSEREK
jgi:Rad3-related DNA helicase